MQSSDFGRRPDAGHAGDLRRAPGQGRRADRDSGARGPGAQGSKCADRARVPADWYGSAAASPRAAAGGATTVGCVPPLIGGV